MQRLPSTEEMYRALVARDASYEGVFFACVKTTGIFCRSTCSARKPKAENVEWVPTVGDALREGYRPCKVCKPLDVAGEQPSWLTEVLERMRQSGAGKARMKDADIRAMGLEPARVRRRFKQSFGMTFQAFQRAWRMGGAMRAMSAGSSSMKMAMESGYESGSGFREAFTKLFGEAPSQAQRGGASCLLTMWFSTPLGRMIGIASDEGIVLLEFLERPALETEIAYLRKTLKMAIVPGHNAHLELLEKELAAYFEDGRREFTVPTIAPGTDFQRRVWAKLCEIPAGETWSYQQLAKSVDCAGGSRAAGRACGENRIAVIIPCHRVVRADGSLGGYGGKLWRKERLLAHERSEVGAARQLLLTNNA